MGSWKLLFIVNQLILINICHLTCITQKTQLAKSKDRVPTDQKTHGVYSIPGGDCEKVYLGQTKRQFCTRLKEHQRAVSNFNSSKSALAEHVCETSHNIAWEDSRIITTNNRYGQRLCLEA